jgi:hypothetical protein
MGNQISFPNEQQTTILFSPQHLQDVNRMSGAVFINKGKNGITVMQHTSEILLKKVGRCIFQSAAHSQMDIAKYIPGFTITK